MSIAATATEAATDVDEAGFRRRVRAFLAGQRARRGRRQRCGSRAARPGGAGLARARAYQAALYEAGLAGLTWPQEYGGQGLPGPLPDHLQRGGRRLRHRPYGVFTIGFGMCMPTVLAHGTEAHKQRFVRPAAQGEEIWCQLFSEPSAGSDVASLRSTAVRDGDEWVLNGQKVWTSGRSLLAVRHRPGPDRSRPAQASRAVDVHPRHAQPRADRFARCGR